MLFSTRVGIPSKAAEAEVIVPSPEASGINGVSTVVEGGAIEEGEA